jgi:hypothetical protein
MSKLAPFRFQMDFVGAKRDLENATTFYDRLVDLAEGMGLQHEGGFIGSMPLEEVAEDSWLALKLRGEA